LGYTLVRFCYGRLAHSPFGVAVVDGHSASGVRSFFLPFHFKLTFGVLNGGSIYVFGSQNKIE
jgi:hypothetical protein